MRRCDTLTSRMQEAAVRWLDSGIVFDPAEVGGKVARLAALATRFDVPKGFALAINPADPNVHPVAAAYNALGERCACRDPAVAVRSSAMEEDGAHLSFAGQHETILNVRGVAAVTRAVMACMASAHSPRAMTYRESAGLGAPNQFAVLIQAMVVADVALVAFSINPITNEASEIVINASWGLGESVVGGTVTPDEIVVGRRSRSVLRRYTASKARMTVIVGDEVREVFVPRALRAIPCLSDRQAIMTAQLVSDVEMSIGEPVDLEAAWAGERLHLLQARPITTAARNKPRDR